MAVTVCMRTKMLPSSNVHVTLASLESFATRLLTIAAKVRAKTANVQMTCLHTNALATKALQAEIVMSKSIE